MYLLLWLLYDIRASFSLPIYVCMYVCMYKCIYVFNQMSLLGSSQPLHFFLINDIERTINSFHSVPFFCFITIKKRRKRKKEGQRMDTWTNTCNRLLTIEGYSLFFFFFLLCNYTLFYLSSSMIEYNMQKCILITR